MKNEYHLLSWLVKKYTGSFTRHIFILISVALLQPLAILHAQNNTSPEAESQLKKEAAKYFEEGNFTEAYPLYSQLLSLYQRDPDYNYHFGACLLYTRADKNKAVDYLEFAVQHPPVDNLAYYYIGRALHLNYRFNEAVYFYKKFQQTASSSELKKYPVTRFIEMCANGRELLANLRGLDVLRKKELNFSDYTEAYEMRANGGTLLSEPDAFKTKIDKGKKETSLIYLTPDKSEAFFSSYGNSENTGKDIYHVKRNPDGSWGAPENLGSVINTNLDEDYPVYDAPRNTLYFSSKGHNSMGGYDIFRSVYNDTYDSWSEPENLDFPVNTPDDDILFIPDSTGKLAFFASTRSSPQNMIDVYKIVLHLHPPQTLVVAGTAYKDGGKTPGICKITVRDIKTNATVGVYTSSAEDGKYSFSLPNGGSYEFTIEDSVHKAQSQAVVLPVEEAMSAMKQDIQFDASGALQIKNYPPASGMPEDSDYRLAYNYIMEQAQMDVNVDTNSIQTLLAQSTAATSDSNLKSNTGINVANSSQIANTGIITNSETANTGIRGAPSPKITNIEMGSSNNSKPANTRVRGTANLETANTGIGDTTNSKITNTEISSANNSETVNTGINDTNNLEAASTDSQNIAKSDPEQQLLNTKAANAINYAGDEMDQALQLELRANTILNSRNGNDNSGANPDSIAVAKNLLNQSAALEEKGMEAYKLAAAYKSEAAAKQPQINAIGNPNSDTGSLGKAPADTQTSDNSNSELQTRKVSPGDLIREQAEQVKEDSLEVAHTNDGLNQEIGQLEQSVQSFIAQAGQTNDSQEKVALLQQADNLSQSRQVKQEEVEENNGELQQLHKEYTWLNNKAQKADNTFMVQGNKNDTTNVPQPALQQAIDEYAAANNSDSASADNNSNNNLENEIADANENSNSSNKSNIIDNTNHFKHSHYRKNTTPASQEAAIGASSASTVPNASVTASQTLNGSTSSVPNPVSSSSVASSQMMNKDTSSTSTPSNTSITTSSPRENSNTSSISEPVSAGVAVSSQIKNEDSSSASAPVNTSVIASSQTKNKGTTSGVSTLPVSTGVATSLQTNHTDTTGALAPVSTGVITSPQSKNIDTSNVSSIINSNTIDSSQITKNIDTSSISVPPNTVTTTSSQTVNMNTSSVSEPVTPGVAASSPIVNKDTSTASIPAITNASISSQTKNADPLDVSAPVNTNTAVSPQTTKNADPSVVVSAPVNTSAVASPQKANTDITHASAQPETIANAVVPSSKIPEEALSSSAPNIQYTDTVSASLNQKSQDYFSSATSLSNNAARTRKEAYNEQDQNKSGLLYSKADSLDNVVSQLNLKGAETLTEANYQQYRTNLNKIAAIGIQPVKNQSDSPNSYRDNKAQLMLVTADSAYRKSVSERDSAENNSNPVVQHTYIESANKDLATAILQQQNAISIYTTAASEQIANVPAKLNSNDNVHPIYSDPSTSEKEKTINIFEEIHNSLYSVSNPIPMNPPLPTGVIFKVQVGAFRKPIPQNLFQGIEPVIGLSSPDGLIRYSAGLFSTLSPAKDALGKIRSDGYPGAFIVAFYNGKRITIKEALAKLGATPAIASSEGIQASSNEETPIISGPVTIAENIIVPSKETLIDERKEVQRTIKDTAPPAAKSFKKIRGLVFTVQVGSYSKRKGYIKLRKIKHLYYWTDTNGIVKYNSGTYASIADAEVARNIIVANTPVKDAFVSAYYNGERITTKQAKDLLNAANTHPKQ